MKKYLLGLLVILFSFISFSNADFLSSKAFVGDVTCTNSWGSCSFLSIPGNSSLVVEGDFNYLVLKCNQTTVFNVYPGVGFTTPDCGLLKLETYRSQSGQVPFIVKVYKFNDYTSVLSPAINGLRGVVYQIIPYVIYIGIGVLISILGFHAIRWLVNWMGGKFNSYFRSKRN